MLSEFISVTVDAATTNANAFANSRYATLSKPARVTYYAVEDGALTAPDLEMEITHGNVIVRSLSAIPVAAAGLGPDRNTALVASGVADINDRIVIRLVNGGATGDANVRIIVDIEF